MLSIQSQTKPFQVGSVVQAIESIQRSYAPTTDFNTNRPTTAREGKPNVDCEFMTVMYNKKYGNAYQQDPLLTGTLLEKAEHNNLDPDNYYPVCEIGIDALSRRIENQNIEVAKCNEHIKNVVEIINSVDQSNTQLSVKCNDLKSKQAKLLQKMMTVLRKVEILRCNGAELQESEQKYRQRLTQILNVMRKPYNELQELSNSMALQDAPADHYAENISEDDMAYFCSALQKQREGLEYITEMLVKDVRDVGIIRDHLSAAQQPSGDNSPTSESKM